VLTKSRPPVLLGLQRPLYRHVPPGKSPAGQEAVDLAASAGLILDLWQQDDLRGALTERRDGRWAAFEVAELAPRQNGKNGILEARQLAGLFLFGEALQTHTAHRADATLEHFLRMKPLCQAVHDQIGDRKLKLRRINESHGQESIELMTGQRLNFKARSKDSGRAFSGQAVYLDEAMRLTDIAALLPTLSAQPNPQLWYSSSSPLPKIESDILRRICRRGRRAARGKTREPRLAYFEHCALADPGERPDAPEDSDEFQAWYAAWLHALAEANPALGIRLTVEFCETERGAMTHEEFLRERLGIYPEDLAGTEAVIDEDDWKACAVPESKLAGPLVLVFEVRVDRNGAVIASVGPSTVGGTHVEIIENRGRTGWVVKRLIELRDKHHPAAIICNPSGPAGGLLADCDRAGLVIGLPLVGNNGKLTLHQVTSADNKQACQAAYDDIIEHRWRHIGQASLTAAATGAGKKDQGDGFVFDRRGLLDPAPLTAVSLGAWASAKLASGNPLVPGMW